MELTNEQFIKLNRWVLEQVNICGSLSRQENIEEEMDAYLYGMAQASRAIDSKKYAMKIVRDMWAAFGARIYMSYPPPRLKNETN